MKNKTITNKNIVHVFKRRVALLFLAFWAISLNTLLAQTVTIPAANTNSGSVNDPFGTYWGFERSAMIYTPAQIGTSGTINSVAFFINALNTPGNIVNFRIYMKHRPNTFTATSTYATEVAGATSVFGPSTVNSGTLTANAWNTITLSTPFVYNGTDNLEVICETNATATGNEGSTGKQIRYNTQGTNQFYQAWNQDNTAPAGNGTRSTLRPNIQLVFGAPPTCFPSTGLTAVVTSGGTGANISWNVASPVPSNGYQFAVNTSSTPPGSGTPFGGTSTSVGSLTPNTTYYLHVRSDCGAGNFSSWATISFFTGYCVPLSNNDAFPDGDYISNVTTTGGISNFNNSSSADPTIPYGYQDFTATSCSQFAGGSINVSVTNASNAFGDGGKMIWVDWNGDFDFLDAGETVFSQGSGSGLTANATFSVPGAQPLGNYRMRVMNVYATFNYLPCNTYSWAEAEDYTFTVVPPPACGIPTSLAATLTSTTSVDVSWVAPGAGTVVNYEYAVTTSATPPGSGTINAGTSVTGVAVLANTNYYLHVRTNCTGPATSPWATFGPFFTGYCQPSSTNAFEYINSFVTSGGVVNINNVTNGQSAGGYGNFTAQFVSAAPGDAFNFTLTQNNSWDQKRIWVDWNNNLVFEDAEQVYVNLTPFPTPTSVTGSITVPALQPLGNYRMRVRIVDIADAGLPTVPSCGLVGYGEAEDYTVSVIAPPTCYPVTGLTVNPTSTTTANLSWTGPVLGNPAQQYYYAVTTSAAPPAFGLWISNGLSTTVTGAATTPNVLNYLHVRTDCDPLNLGSDYSNWAVLSFFSGYCEPTATNNNSTYLTNFTTTGGITNVNNPSTFSTLPSGYQDFTAQSFSTYAGQTIGTLFTMFGGTAGINVWVDWNNDLDFTDPGEFAISTAGFVPDGTYGGPITVPALQPVGNYRLRIRTDFFATSPGSCGNITRGEAEDYTFSVIPLPTCASVLGSFASTYTTSTDLPLVCTGQTVNFAVSPAAPLATGITYRLQFSTTIGGTYNTVAGGAGGQVDPQFSLVSPASGFYRIQVLCSGTPVASTWVPVAVSLSNPAITTTTPASRCGTGTVTLSATNTPPLSTITWYQTASGGLPLGTGPSFTTPSLSTTTSYYVQAGNDIPNATIGAGANPSNAAVITPLHCLWESSRNWYLIRKSELQAAGLVSSDFTSLAINVTGSPAVPMLNYTIKIAHTTAPNINLGYGTANSGFTTVFGPATVTPPAIGLYTFPLIGGAFIWNGNDNIIIEICHSNDPSGTLTAPVSWGTSGTVLTSNLTFNCTYGIYNDDLDYCPLTSDPNPFPNTPVLTNTRPNFTIGAQISACNSPRVEVIATINTVPNIVVPGNQNFAPSVGNFNPIPLTVSSATPGAGVTVTPPASIYTDAATNGLYIPGDNINGVVQYYAPLTTTTYTATADLPNGCTSSGTYTITVDQSGIPASACAATSVTSTNNLTWIDVNTLGSAGGLGAPCGGIINEVWFKTVVSSSGEIHISTRENGLSLTDITETNIALFREVAPFGCANINNVACNTNGGVGSFSYANAFDLTPGETIYIRVAGLSAATVSIGRFEMSVANYLVWTPTNGNNIALAENWQGGDATAATVPSATRSIWIPAGTTTPQLNANLSVRGVNIQAPSPFFVSPGINLNGFTLNVKGNWNVGPVANASTTLPCNGLVEFNGNGATPQLITGRTTFGNLNTNNTVGGVQANGITGVSCVLTPVAGNFNANGNLVLKSTAANTAALVAPSAGTITGDASVERKIGTTSGYHYLSAPVSGATVNNTSTGWRDDFTILAALDGQVFIPGTVYSQLASVWEYDETNPNPNPDYGWIGATGAGDNITPLKGFACVVPANVTVDVKGPLNNNIIPGGYTITRSTDGTNMVGNPYASPISWNAFRALPSNTAALSTSGYKAFLTTGGYAGTYGTWNGAIGSPVQVTDRIASSQSFIVECLQPVATINALNTIRLTTPADVTSTFFSGYNSVPDMMRMEVQGNGHASEMVVYFDAAYADAYNNNIDSKVMYSPVAGVPTIYSTVENNNLAINVMGKLNLDKVVPVGVKIQTAGTYNFVATDMTSFAPSVVAYLEDTQAGTMTNLRTNPSYSVTLPVGEINNRFFIHFHPAVELNAVNETCAGNDGKLIINYPTSNSVNIVIKDANGNVVNAQNNVTGLVTINNLVAGNYVAEMTFGVAPNTYTTADYFTVAGGNAVYANLSASANTVDMNANTTVNFTATAQGATSFNWNFGDGTVITNGPANISHTFAQAGTYNVTFEASNGICNTVATTTVEVTNATGLVAISNSNLQVIGVGSRVTVRFGNKMEGTGNIEVINMLGEVVAHLDNVSMKGTREIEMSSVAAGQYMVKITNNNKLFTEKVYLSRQ